jgi:hypothetical protein
MPPATIDPCVLLTHGFKAENPIVKQKLESARSGLL